MQYNFRFNNKFLFLCENQLELNKAIEQILKSDCNKTKIDEYITNHCLPHHSSPSANINELLLKGIFKQSKFGFKEVFYSIFYWGPIRKILETFSK